MHITGAMVGPFGACSGLATRTGREKPALFFLAVAASCPPRIGGLGSTSTLAIEGDPAAIAAQTSTQRKCVVKDSLRRTGARFGVLLLHTLSHLHKSRRVSNRCRFFAGAAG
jgi:hypothetical protein